MERDVCYAFFFQDQHFKIAGREYQREARDAVNQAVRESLENYEVTVMQEFQSIQNQYEAK